MRALNKALTIVALSAAMVGASAASGAGTAGMGETMDADHFVKMADTNKDGMVSKAEMMKMVEKMWDKMDTKKAGKMDKAQVEAFLKELMKGGG